MTKLTTAIFAAALALTLSCNKDVTNRGPVVTDSRTLAAFHAMDLRMNGNVYYHYSPDNRIEITAREGAVDQLVTEVINDKLIIRFKNGDSYGSNDPIRLDVFGPLVNHFSLNSSGSIYCLDDLASPEIFLRTTASGNLFLKDLVADVIQAECTESGSIHATGGSAVEVILKTRASGSIDFSQVSAGQASAHTESSGHIKIKVSDELDARIDGSGSVYFSGYPVITTHISGSGRLVRID